MDDRTMSLRLTYLKSIAKRYSSTCPSLSRLYMYKIKEMSESEAVTDSSEAMCPYCSNFYHPDSISVRLLPKVKLTKQIRKLMRKYQENQKRLGKYQKRLLIWYLTSANRMCIKCKCCGKTVKVKGQTRKMVQPVPEAIEPVNRRKKSKKKSKLKTNLHELSILELKERGLHLSSSTPNTPLVASEVSAQSPSLLTPRKQTPVSSSTKSTGNEAASFSLLLLKKSTPLSRREGKAWKGKNRFQRLQKILADEQHKKDSVNNSLSEFLQSL